MKKKNIMKKFELTLDICLMAAPLFMFLVVFDNVGTYWSGIYLLLAIINLNILRRGE